MPATDLHQAAFSCGAMVLGDEGTRQQYLFDLEQLGALVALLQEGEAERKLPPLPY